jgi:formylglycine-generating enzyme required for sulfatase activity
VKENKMNTQFKIVIYVMGGVFFAHMLSGCVPDTTPIEKTKTEISVSTEPSRATQAPIDVPQGEATRIEPLDAPETPTDTLVPTAISLHEDFIDENSVLMGNENGSSNESPVHTVYLDAFYMDIYEVTNTLYELCVNKGACTEPHETKSFTRDTYYGNSAYDNYPVIYVDWNQAREFCDWRDARLPTEAEWEKAARGGLEGKLWPWGDQEPDCSSANYKEEDGYCEGDSTKVGSYSPNGLGLFDMAGNVWEWVWDWYSSDYYELSPLKNPLGPDLGSSRGMRGGSFVNLARDIRVALRFKFNPDEGFVNIGFRCARSADTIPTPTPSP